MAGPLPPTATVQWIAIDSVGWKPVTVNSHITAQLSSGYSLGFLGANIAVSTVLKRLLYSKVNIGMDSVVWKPLIVNSDIRTQLWSRLAFLRTNIAVSTQFKQNYYIAR